MCAFPKSLTILLVMTILLGACAPAQSTQSPEQVQSQVSTSVAMTIAAQDTQTAAAQPSSTATSTSTAIPLPTFPPLTPVFPTATTFVVVPPSSSGGGGGGSSSGGSCRDPQRCCAVVDQEPEDWPDPNAIVEVGHRLDVKWNIQNIGTKAWDPTWTFTYWKTVVDSSEPANVSLTTSSTAFTPTIGSATGGLPVDKKDFVTLSIELTGPDFEGSREPIKIMTQWAITGDGARFCAPYIYIEVVKPGMTP